MTIYQGDIFYCKDLKNYIAINDGYLIVSDQGKILSVGSYIPEVYKNYPVKEYRNQLILPAFCDIHLHSSQFVNIGLGYDIEFEDWLLQYTYPAEEQYQNLKVADELNRRLINELWNYGTMHAVIMGSTDTASVWNLMEHFSRSGMSAYIGKMNADVAAFGNQAEIMEQSIEETIHLIEKSKELSDHVTYCISPEFIPNCSDELMKRLGELAITHQLPVQSHLAEGEADVVSVEKRYSGLKYAQIYEKYNLFGQTPTVMAHGIYASENERKRMSETNVTLAHCPIAISNIPSGKPMPLRRFLEEEINVGLGSDIGGGHTVNMMRIVESTVHYSKFQKFIDDSTSLSILEAYALATVGGGKVFGKVGSFEPEYSFDGLIIDDTKQLPKHLNRSIIERVQRFLYGGDASVIKERYCCGKKIEKPFHDLE
jgi:guanine deaminase